MSDLTHLPADIRASLDRYDADVADGKITFDDRSPFAETFPGDTAIDSALGNFVAGNVREV